MAFLISFLAAISLGVSILTVGSSLRILFRCSLNDDGIHALIETALGGIALSWVAFLPAFLGLATPTVMGVLPLLCALPCLKHLPSALKHWQSLYRQTFGELHALVKTFLGALLFLWILNIASPPDSNDELAFHLLNPSLILNEHHLPDRSDIIQKPLIWQMLYTYLMIAGQDWAPRLLNVFCFGAAIMGLMLFAKRYLSLQTGEWVLLLTLTIPSLFDTVAKAHTEWMTIWMISTTLLLFIEDARQRSLRNLMVCAVMIGFSTGCKYPSLALLPLFALSLLTIGIRNRLDLRQWCYLVFAGGVAVGCASPWYLRNQLLYKAPFHPYRLPMPDTGQEPPPELSLNIPPDPVPLDIPPPLPLLWRNFFAPRLYGWSVGPVFAVALPFLLCNLRSYAHARWCLLYLVFILILFWKIMTGGHDFPAGRYMAPYLMLCIPSIAFLFSEASRRNQILKTALFIMIALPMLLNLAWLLGRTRHKLKYPMGLESRGEYYRNRTPFASAIEWLNQNAPPSSLVVSGDPRVYHLQLPFIISHGPHPLIRFQIVRTPESFVSKLRDMGAQFLLVNYVLTAGDPYNGVGAFISLHSSKLERLGLTKVFESDVSAIVVYRITQKG